MNSATSWKIPVVLVVVLSPLIFWNPLLALGGIVALAFLAWLLVKPLPPLTFWVGLLAIFYFFPYSSINPSVRSAGTYFTLFRKFGGLLSAWDFLLLAEFAVLFAYKLGRGKATLRGWNFPELLFLSLFSVWAFVWGWVHVFGNLLGYGPTDLLRPVVIFQVFLYFLAAYLLTLNWLNSQKDWQVAVRWLKWLTSLLVLYGVGRLIGILLGKIETMWPFGLPVVLYDQMMFLYLPIFVWLAAQILGKSDWKGLGWVALISTFFILISARRFNYFLLVFGGGITVLLAGFLTPRFAKKLGNVALKLGGALVLVFFLLAFFFPSGLKNVGTAFQSLNIYSQKQTVTAGSDIRRQEIKNLVLNLNERPYGYAFGLGWGTKWKAIAYQPMDSFSFTEKYLKKSLGWFPQFHLPYLGLLYRYGVLGLLFFWGILLVLFRRIFLGIQKSVPEGEKAFLLGMLVFLVLLLPTFGDSANPTFMILAGFYLGLLEFRLTVAEEPREC